MDDSDPEPDPVADEGDDVGGSPACFAHLLCPECAAVPEAGATACWRCGADLPRRE
ncbi:hypothetical protein [Pseudonocardia sp.]|uniref:hypothetical protein n=1 Tax=Pseudonocardia sp. TaxID=60912 RepID=UPI003D0A0237